MRRCVSGAVLTVSALATATEFPAARLGSLTRVAYAQSMRIPVEDSALMLRYRDGDVAAFETLYRRHKDPLYRYLVRLSLNRDTADDVFQDVWSKIVKARDSYRATARFSTFLYRVAHNCFIDHVRRNKRHANSALLDPDTQPAPDNGPELIMQGDQARQRMLAALATLPEEQRDVFLLYEEAGLSVENIAKVTGVNHETAKSRLRYAVTKLKAALAQTGAEVLLSS